MVFENCEYFLSVKNRMSLCKVLRMNRGKTFEQKIKF